jgi:ribonuclease Z
MTDIYSCWYNPLSIGNNLTLRGDGRAARASGYTIRELGINLDAGLRCPFIPSIILVTHGHCDHCNELPVNMIGTKPNIPILIPVGTKEKFVTYVRTLFQLTTNSIPTKSNNLIENSTHTKNNNYIEMKDGDTYTYVYGNREYIIEAFSMDHSVPCIGFGISECRKKLKEEYVGKKLNYNELRKQGIDITELHVIPQLCYLGDTHISFFKNEKVFNYPTIITECSFLYDGEEELANKKKHVHWNDLKPYTMKHPNVNFVLTHFSTRYSIEDIRSFFIKQKCSNVIPYRCEEIKKKPENSWLYNLIFIPYSWLYTLIFINSKKLK